MSRESRSVGAGPAQFSTRLWLGVCAGTVIEEAHLARLLPAEHAFVAAMPVRRQREWASGRHALRSALAAMGREAGPLLADDRGAPLGPAGITVSIAHTATLAIAIAADAALGSLGIDVEHLQPDRPDITRVILTAAEQRRVPAEVAERERHLLSRFALKEAIYKAIAPFERRFVEFDEVEVIGDGDDLEAVTALPYEIELEHHWRHDLVIAVARARRSDGAAPRP